jgi:hypothetical protein
MVLLYHAVPALLVAVSSLFLWLPVLTTQKHPADVPKGLDAAWTTQNDTLWLRWYRFVWREYPEDIWSYVGKSVALTVVSIAWVLMFHSSLHVLCAAVTIAVSMVVVTV